MPLRLSNLRLGVEQSELALVDRLSRELGVRTDDIASWRILRKSLDARKKADLYFVYSVEVTLRCDEASRLASRMARRTGVQVEPYIEPPFCLPSHGSRPLRERPVVVGSGPAGLMAALFLAEQGYAPVILERGRKVGQRIRDVKAFDAGGALDRESNYLFGEGGAGTFSDGKLTCRVSGPDVQRVLGIFAECKGKPSLLYDHRPHLGSNRLPAVVKALRRRIESAGGEFRFECRLEQLNVQDGCVRGLETSSGSIPAEVVVLAIGHSARDTYQMLYERGVPMVPKPFQFGLRIEQPQEQVNRVQYGNARWEEQLGAADYSLIARGTTNVFTFCMCAGGQVIPSVSEPGAFCTNGMSLSRRSSPFANSGLMITLDPADFGGQHALAGMHLQRHFESLAFALSNSEYRCPIQGAKDFLAGRASRGCLASSYSRGVVLARLEDLLPSVAHRAIQRALPMLDQRWAGKFLANATLVGPESRGSSPVRLPRDPTTLESPQVAGLIPIGEGAGYAGGIVSAALDGLRAAKAIIGRHAPLASR